MASRFGAGSVSYRVMTRLWAIALVALLPACSSGDGAGPPASPEPTPIVPTALFVLGDSLSDVGNAAGAADYLLNRGGDTPRVGLCEPIDVLVLSRSCDDLFYARSRVSDGAVAVEHLAQHLGLPELTPSLHVVPNRSRTATNYAVASAKARGANNEDLGPQVDWLLLDHTPLPPNAVYVLMIGGNDALDALQADLSDVIAGTTPSAAIVTSAVASIGSAIERLLDFGARRLVVANVPDLAMLPAVRTAAPNQGDEVERLAAARAISASFNQQLDALLTRINASGRWLAPTPPIVERFDLAAVLGAALEATAASGGNAADACFDSDAYRQSGTAERVFHPDCAPTTVGAAPRFSEFAFWDGIHPTSTTHAAIGTALGTLF